MNSRLQTAAHSMQQATHEISESVRPLSRPLLLWRPSPDVWSILDNLAHIEEFVPFWIGEIQAMLATQPQPWGRDQSHPGRLAAVRDTSARDADELLASIKARVASACQYLGTLDDSCLDIEAQSRNPGWAVKPVSFVLDTLLVKHLSDHRGQIQRNLRQAAEAGMMSAASNGIVHLVSDRSVSQVLERLLSILHEKAITVFAVVDHSGEAAKVGMEMHETKLVIFGNPKAGTPLMLAAPDVALDLPMKLLIAQDSSGTTRISYNDPAWLQARYRLTPDLLRNIAGIAQIAAEIIR